MAWFTVLGVRVLFPGNASAHSLAETQAKAQTVVQANNFMDAAADRYLEIVRERMGFNSVQELRETLNELMAESRNNPSFRRFCNQMFECKDILISSAMDSTEAQAKLLEALRRDPVPPLVHIHTENSQRTTMKVTKGKVSLEEAYQQLTLSGETKPFYVTNDLARLWDLEKGWVLVIIRVEDTVKTVRGKEIDLFTMRVLIMRF